MIFALARTLLCLERRRLERRTFGRYDRRVSLRLDKVIKALEALR
jgi:hypothetical protein